jgi:hypothetical protein
MLNPSASDNCKHRQHRNDNFTPLATSSQTLLSHFQVCSTTKALAILVLHTLLMFGGMALPPTPMRLQSMWSPSSVKVSRPTTTPFSDATTARQQQQQQQQCYNKEPAHHNALLRRNHCRTTGAAVLHKAILVNTLFTIYGGIRQQRPAQDARHLRTAHCNWQHIQKSL